MSIALCCLTFLTISSDEDLTKIRALAANDPQAAVDLAQPLWEGQNHPQRLEIGVALAGALAKLNRNEDVIRVANQIIEESPNTSRASAKAMVELIGAITDLRAWDAHPTLFARAEIIANQAPSKGLTSDILSHLGVLCYHQAKYKQAETLVQRCIQELGDEPTSLLASHYQNLAVMRAQQSNFADAFEAMLKAQEIYDQLGRPDSLNMLKNLGGMSFNMGDFELSRTYTQRAIDTGEATGHGLAMLYSNLGAANMSLGDEDQAYLNFSKALETLESVGESDAQVLNNMGYLLINRGDYRKAAELLQEAVTLSEANKSFELVAVANKNLGDVWMKLGDGAKAAAHFERAYELYIDHDLRPKRLELYPLMIENLEQLGQTSRALSLMHEFKALNDETVTVESNARVAELQSAIELERNKRELASSERDRALKAKSITTLKSEQSTDRIVRYGLIILVLALGTIALLLIRAIRFKSRANRVLADKNQEIASLNTELRKLSVEDVLTGLANRRYLTEFMARESPKIVRAFKEQRGQPILFILADLDHFKRVNDTYGHQAGDQVLRTFADVLRSCGRESDVIVRWGGEEFLWVCRDASSDEGPELCERLLQRSNQTTSAAVGKAIQVTCSMGFAQFPLAHGEDADWAKSLKLADKALYEAKRAGRNGWMGYRCRGTPDRPLSVEDLQENAFLDRISSPKFELA